MSTQRFRSKIDGLFYLMSALGVGLPVGLGLMSVRDGRWVGLIVGLAIGVFLAALARTTYYDVDDRSLTIRCLLGGRTIPLKSITSLRPTNNPLSAPALSLDRIAVAHTDGAAQSVGVLATPFAFGCTMVSPNDKPGFVEAIRRAQPSVVVGSGGTAPLRAGWMLAAMTLAPISIVLVMLYANSRQPTVVVAPSALTVSGPFGITVPMRDIADVTLDDRMPRVIRKRSGSDGLALRGRFELEGIGDGQIYVQRSGTRYVHIRTRDSFLYINYSDSARTQALFDEVTRARASASETGTSTILR